MLTGTLTTVGCDGSDKYCPGLCPIDSIHPTMTIEVADDVSALTRAEIVSDPCSRLLLHSAGEAGMPTGYAAVQITYNGPVDIPPLCLVELTSLDGQTVVVTTSVTVSQYEQPCCPGGGCCPKTSAVSLHKQVVFDQPVQTVGFPIPPGLDGGATDAALDEAAESAADAEQGLDLAGAF